MHTLKQLRTIHKFEMASQIFRRGTSIDANIMEAQNAESKADEVLYWLKLCEA